MNKISGVSALSYRQIVVLIIAVLVSFLLAELIRWHMDKKKRDKNIVKIVRSQMFWYVILAIVIAVIFQLLQISYISGKLKNLAINLDSGLNNRSMKSFYALPITIENQYQDYNYKMSYGFPSASAFNLGPTLMNNYIQFEFFKQTKTNIRFQAYNTNTRGIFYKQMVKVGNPKDRINIDDSRYILLSPENDDNSLDKNVFSGEIVDLIGKMLDYFDVIIYEDSKIVGRIYPCWANANSNIEYDRIKSILELVTKL